MTTRYQKYNYLHTNIDNFFLHTFKSRAWLRRQFSSPETLASAALAFPSDPVPITEPSEMHLTSTLVGLLMVCLVTDLPIPAAAQFWKAAMPTPSWRSEALAERPSGICYMDLKWVTSTTFTRDHQKLITINYFFAAWIPSIRIPGADRSPTAAKGTSGWAAHRS